MTDQEIAQDILTKFTDNDFQVKSSARISKDNYFEIILNNDGNFTSIGSIANKVTLFVESHYSADGLFEDRVASKIAVLSNCLVPIYGSLEF